MGMNKENPRVITTARAWKLSHFEFDILYPGELFFISGGNGFLQCIPYNKQTKHLLGTTDNWEE